MSVQTSQPITKNEIPKTPIQLCKEKDFYIKVAQQPQETISVIVIDPGHGVIRKTYMDHGALLLKDPNGKDRGDNVQHQESDITLDISKKLKAKIENLKAGFTVYLTREGEVNNLDSYSELERPWLDFRWKFANDKAADLFISIHCNSSGSKTASGFIVCYDVDTPNNIKLAESIISSVTVYDSKLKKHRKQNLGALKGFKKTAILIEVGFLTNESDLKKMTTDSSRLATEIANGVKKYIDEKK